MTAGLKKMATFASTLALLVMACPSHAAPNEPDLAQVGKAVQYINELAQGVCPAAGATGYASNSEAAAHAKAEVSKFVKRIGDLKLEGSAKFQSSEYQGLLQQDVLRATQDTLSCRRHVFDEVKDRLLPKKSTDVSVNLPKSVARPSGIQPASIVGAWKEYVRDPRRNQWVYIGTYDVAKNNSGYIISAREQREFPTVMPSIGIFDVRSDGDSWKFNSNWGQGLVGNFALQRVSETEFQGPASIGGIPIAATRWVRVQ